MAPRRRGCTCDAAALAPKMALVCLTIFMRTTNQPSTQICYYVNFSPTVSDQRDAGTHFTLLY
jgi:hypothetical protein